MGGIVGGLFGSGAPSQSNVQVYQPSGTSNIDQQLQGLLTNNTNLVGNNNPYNTYAPQFAQLYSQIYNSPYAGGYQAAGNAAGSAYGAVGNQGINYSGALDTAALASLPGAQQVMNLGLDPQTSLYNQLLQKTMDQANVANAQYGLTGQQAAANEDQATTNFNIDWQNQQLNRALAGLGGYNQTLGAAGAAGSTAQSIGGQGAGQITQGGAVPYGVQTTIGGNQANALEAYIQSLLGPATSSQSTIGNLQNYLNTGVSASQGGANAALGDYYAQLQNSANLGSGLGSLADIGLMLAGY